MTDPIRNLPEHAKTAGDLLASTGAAVSIASHWAAILTPIVTLAIGVVTLIWWGLRFWDRFSGKSDA